MGEPSHDPALMTVTSAHTADPMRGTHDFRRGWRVAHGLKPGVTVDDWVGVAVGAARLEVHPAQDFRVLTLDGNRQLVLIGHVVDTAIGLADQDALLRIIAVEWATRGREHAIRNASYLGGRWLIAFVEGESWEFLPDTGATIQCFAGSTHGGWLAGSHEALVAETVEFVRDEGLLGFRMQSKKESVDVVFAPGLSTEYLGLRRLIANHTLSANGKHFALRRFYPFSDSALVGDEYDRFAHHLIAQTAYLASLPEATLSLTAGLDSRTSAHAAYRSGTLAALTMWTFTRPGNRGEAFDNSVAALVARSYGFQHKTVPFNTDSTDEIRSALNRTYPNNQGFVGLTSTIFNNFSRSTVQLQSTIAEIGNGFYKNRNSTRIDASRLASMQNPTTAGRSLYAKQQFEKFIDEAEFSENSLGPLDFHDALYWESRQSVWAALRIQQLDFVQRAELPYNNRHVIEALLSAPWPARRYRRMQRRFLGLI